ncbi:unnamed protein product [Caenorhabditis bovis]|uniref:Proline-rich protein PRCC n=1 Tax=Caenorhabditis bovis TaxID=2654633 RepID=A0A8S1F3A2_9PELO|nr:unnamed protein product [Caenorhabditis bovis]
MALVDYAGSDSDSEDELTTKAMPATLEKNAEDEDFFRSESRDTEESTLQSEKVANDDVLEDIVKPKNWELKLAEKQKKKLEKKAKKAAKKEKKKSKNNKEAGIVPKISSGVKKPKPKVQISAFGALASIAGSISSDSDDDELISKESVKGIGFLSSLPAPKGKNNVTGDQTISSFVPFSKATPDVPSTSLASKLVDSEDDDYDPLDFFGFSLASKKVDKIPDEPQVPQFTEDMEMVGPSKPSQQFIYPSQLYNMAEVPEEPAKPKGKILTDEMAQKLIMRFSQDIGPGELKSFNEITSNLIDVNVDDAIGPNVKSNILKNLGHRQFSEATKAPLPQAPVAGQMSRKKHQITYLANLAVSREEALKDKWAEQKQTKRMARQKYGF